MNSFYVVNDTVVIFDRAIYTRETGKEEGLVLKIVDSGSAGSFDPLFKTETGVRTTRW
jgi:preprotein translocase subunit SecF